ncbi:MAG: O-antigen ligase family protein [Rhodothermales bacterium]
MDASLMPADSERRNVSSFVIATTVLTVLIAVCFLLAVRNPLLPLVLPVGLIGGLAFVAMLGRTNGPFTILLFAPYVMLQGGDSVSASELVYAGVLVVTLAIWYGDRLTRGEFILTTRGDTAFATFIFLLFPLVSVVALILGAEPRIWVSDVFAALHFMLYFPVKQECAKGRDRMLLAVGALVIGVVAGAFLNFIELANDLSVATRTWEISSLRISDFDAHFVVVSLVLLSLMAVVRRRHIFPLACLFVITFGALILTKSRAFWVVFLLGSFILFLGFSGKRRLRLASVILGGSSLVIGVLVLFFRDYLFLFVAGVLFRIQSIDQGIGDISLRNRVVESVAVLKLVKLSPVIGYGPGTTYRYLDIIEWISDDDNFVHNGYVMLLYKYGVVGFLLMMRFWFVRIAEGWRAVRKAQNLDPVSAAVLLGCVAAMIGLLFSAMTSTPFMQNDKVWLVGMITGIVGGTSQRLHARIGGVGAE